MAQENLKQRIRYCSAVLSKIKKEISRVVIGQEKVVEGLLRALLADGHVLVEGVPGIAKTLLVRALGKVTGGEFKRVQFTVDLLPTDILGITTYTREQGFTIVKGPIFANYILADEINRSPPKCVFWNTPIILENGELENIKSIIKKYNGERTYKNGNEEWIVPKKPLKLLAFNPANCKIEPEEVRYLYKQKTREPYHEVKLNTGRKIKTSIVHPFFTLKEGKVGTIQASNLKEGDCVLIPKIIPVKGKNKLIYNIDSLKESQKIKEEIARRKSLYSFVSRYRNLPPSKIIKKFSPRDKNIVRTFLKSMPTYLNYKDNYFFSKARQFGQIHGVKMPESVTKEFAQFIAILIAEGSVDKSSFYISMKNRGMLELFKRITKKLFDLDTNILYDKKRGIHRIAFRSDSLASLLNALGYNTNAKAEKKEIPGFIISSTDNIIKEFLRLYYDCDGCVSRDCIKITTKSTNIANALSYFMLRLGFVAKINRGLARTRIGNYSYSRRFYNIRLYGPDFYDFYKKIGFYTRENNEKLESLIKNFERTKSDLILEMHLVLRGLRKQNNLSHKEFFNLTGMHAHNLENPKNSLMHSRYRLRKILRSLGGIADITQLSKIVNGDFYCDFVKSNRVVRPKKEYWLYDFSMKNIPSFIAGFGGIISHNTQSALLEAMQEKQVTIGKETFSLPLPFFVMATQNPIETAGVYTLPEAQVDRFLFKLLMYYPTVQEEEKIVRNNITLKKFEDFDLKAVITPEKILEMQKITKKIFITKAIEQYIVRIVNMTRNPKGINLGKYIEWGASPRASIGLFIAAKAEALMRGNSFVVPQHVKDVAYDVLRHRILLSYEGQAENIKTEDIITEILSKAPVP